MNQPNHEPVLVVLQLTGGNDYMNTIVPYCDSNYYDSRPSLKIPESEVIKIDNELGFHPSMQPLKEIYDQGNMAIIHGIGYNNPSRSHFRSMDIWHTGEPDEIANEGWLGKVIRDLDPKSENPVTAVNIGQGLPRALTAQNASVSSLASLANFGLLTGVEQEYQRNKMLDKFAKMYSPSIGTGPVMDYLSRTGTDLLNGLDILKPIPSKYSSTVEYSQGSVGDNLKDIAMIHTANVGTKIFYAEHGSFDTHGIQELTHAKLLAETSIAIADFWDDLKEHEADKNVVMLIFSEFGRRVRDNGSGTDHGAAGVAFVLGPMVQGGFYGEYPETSPSALNEGDLVSNMDFRSMYSELIEDWLNLDAGAILDGHYEKPRFIG